ncbi:MAG: PQQ-binding-like beta-propeller repeat protein [Rhizomicrobium sp.]
MAALAWTVPAHAGGKWLEIGYNSGHAGYNKTEKTITAQTVANLAQNQMFSAQANVPHQPVVSKGIVYVRSNQGYLTAYNVATGAQVWQIPLQAMGSWGVTDVNSIAVSGNILVTGCFLTPQYTGLCAFNAKTGTALWTFGFQSGAINSPPTIAGRTVYANLGGIEPNNNGDYSGNMTALDLKTGAERWADYYCDGYPTCASFGDTAPAVDNGMVYFGCSGSTTYPVFNVHGICGVDASSGAYVWGVNIGGAYGHYDATGLLVTQGGNIYLEYNTNPCYNCAYSLDVAAFTEATGSVIWDTPISTQPSGCCITFGGEPMVGPDGSVYANIGVYNQQANPNLFALNAHGDILWSQSTPNALVDSGTLVGKSDKQVLLFSCEVGQAGTCAYSAATGALLWASGDNHVVNFAPIATGGAVYNACVDNDICSYTLK